MPEQQKTLQRPRKNRMLFGVCAGLGEFTNIDPILFRVLFVVLTLANGIGILIYIVCIVLMPEEPGGTTVIKDTNKEKDFGDKMEDKANQLVHEAKTRDSWITNNVRNLIGAAVILLGVVLLLDQFVAIRLFSIEVFGAVIMIILGAYIVVKANRYN